MPKFPLVFLFLAACASEPAPQVAPEPPPLPEEPQVAPKPALEVPPERAVEVTLPTGKTVTADKVTAPEAGTVEHAILESLTQIGAGEFDAWIGTWCHASACGDDESRLSMKTYNLPASKGSAHQCLQDGSVVVTRRDPVERDGVQRVYVYCGPDRMPAPSAHYLEQGQWKVASFSW